MLTIDRGGMTFICTRDEVGHDWTRPVREVKMGGCWYRCSTCDLQVLGDIRTAIVPTCVCGEIMKQVPNSAGESMLGKGYVYDPDTRMYWKTQTNATEPPKSKSELRPAGVGPECAQVIPPEHAAKLEDPETPKPTETEVNIFDYIHEYIYDPETRTYTGTIPSFPGCVAQGNVLYGVQMRLVDAAHSWIDAAKSQGQPIPGPNTEPPPFTIKPYRCEQCNAEIYVRHDAHATDIKVACGACHRPQRKTIEDDDDNHHYASEDCICTGRCANEDGDCTG